MTSCEVSDFISDTFGSEEKKLPEEIADAKTYFDQYASLEIDYELIGMHPGVIVPQWDDAIAVQNGEMVSINVPLFTEATYSGAFYIDRANPDTKVMILLVLLMGIYCNDCHNNKWF